MLDEEDERDSPDNDPEGNQNEQRESKIISGASSSVYQPHAGR